MFNTRLTLSVATLLLAATLVNGASTGGILTGLLLNKLHEFRTSNYAKRQGSNGSGISLDSFPQQCQPGCQVAVNALNTCTLPSCLCTQAVVHSLDTCINCTVKVLPDPTVIQDGQQVFDTFNALCKGTPGIETLSLTGVTLSSTGTNIATASDSFINPFLPASAASATTTIPLGPTTTITAVPTLNTGSTPNPATRSPSISTTSNPLVASDAVALPHASKAYVAVGLVVAFFMCLA